MTSYPSFRVSRFHVTARGDLCRHWELRCLPPRFVDPLGCYQHQVYRRVLYTPGVFEFLQDSGAWWLLDCIAEWIGPIGFHRKLQSEPLLATLTFTTSTSLREQCTALYVDCPGLASTIYVAEHAPFVDFFGDEAQLKATSYDALWLLDLL